MFAVVETGGKQYQITEGTVFKVEKIAGAVGEVITLPDVVLFHDGSAPIFGSPKVAGIAVSAQVLEQKKDDKVLIFKKRRRHNSRRLNGHRQQVTVLRVLAIGDSAKLASVKPGEIKKKQAAPKQAAETAEAEEAPVKKAKSPAKKVAGEKKAAAPKKPAAKAQKK